MATEDRMISTAEREARIPRVATRIRDELLDAHMRLFVGRETEIDSFHALLAADGVLRVLYVTGPGGIGKSTLLHEYGRLASARGVVAHYLDARHLPTTPQALMEALAPLLSASGGRLTVLLIDTFEALEMLEGWFREELLPGLSTKVRIVFASRHAPALEWVVEPGWSRLTKLVELPYFSDEESRDYLQRRGLDKRHHARALELALGSPLALALLHDILAREPEPDVEHGASAELFSRLVVCLLRGIDEPAKRLTLQAAAVVRSINERLLAAMLAVDDAGPLFEWLRQQSFMKSGARGLEPHDLVREAIFADLRQRNPQQHAELAGRAYVEIIHQIAVGSLTDHEQATLDLFFVQRDTFMVRHVYRLEDHNRCYCDAAVPADLPLVEAILARHEDEDSLRCFRYWHARQPKGLVAVRDRTRRLTGFLFQLDVARVARGEATADPVVERALAWLKAQPALAPGEKAVLCRYWMSADSYQTVSPEQTRVCAWLLLHTITTPGLAYAFYLQPDHPVWERVSAQGMHRPVPGPVIEQGGHRRVLYVHNCRETPPQEWLRGMFGRMRDLQPAMRQVPFSEAEFAEAVKQALRHYTQADRLRDNLLLGTRLVARVAAGDMDEAVRLQALRQLVAQHCREMDATDPAARLGRVLHRTYLQPAPSRAAAAEALHLSERTYRRRLTRAAHILAATLWQAERVLWQEGSSAGE